MRSTITIILIFVGVIFSKAQFLTPVVISGAGSDGNAGDYHLTWTLGEVAITSHIQPDVTLLQGFHQPEYIITQLVEGPEKDFKILVYPNPVSDYINIEVTGIKNPLKFEMYDLVGLLIMKEELENPFTRINMATIPDGAYLFRIRSDLDIISGVWRILKF
ncbi:MAG: T9SS type A sorting domain-containing protein [Saprospiraceae bacterium]|nr:T9SS type A sorting domain-containing protein [Saprospiraceae bacterium]MCB9325122.1 T9SS type A sorting domain-containing protein [Lewinellaceae bacterium]